MSRRVQTATRALITSKFLTRVQHARAIHRRIDAVRALLPHTGPLAVLAFFRAAGLNRCKRAESRERAGTPRARVSDERSTTGHIVVMRLLFSSFAYRHVASCKLDWQRLRRWMCRRVVVGSINMPAAYAINSIPTQPSLPPPSAPFRVQQP